MASGTISSRGQPSKGCTKCRSRKIKCDMGRPVCQRCIKIGHNSCTYRDDFDIILRDQTSQTAERAQDKWRSRSKRAKASSPSGSDLGVMSSPSSHSDSPSSIRSIDNPVLQRFFYDWVVPEDPNDDFPAARFLEFIPEMFHRSGPDSPLGAAVWALAYANYTQRCNSPESATHAISHCNEALKLLQNAMNNPVEACSDDTLTAIQLMGLYEMMTSPIAMATGSYIAHLNGQISLVKLRSLQSSPLSGKTTLLAMTVKQMLIQCLMRAIPATIPRTVVSIFTTSKYKVANVHWDLMYDASELFVEWKQALLRFIHEPNEFQVEEVCTFIEKGISLDKSLENWSRGLPPEWGYTLKVFNKQTTPQWLWPLLETSWTPRFIHEYSSQLIEYKWREWWLTKTWINQAIIQTIGHLETRGFGVHTWPPSIAHVKRSEVEHTLLTSIEGLFESCVSILVRPFNSKPIPKSIQDVCSLRGFLIFPQLGGVHCCLLQTPFLGVDMEGRREWSSTLVKLVNEGLGFAKVTVYTRLEKFEPLHIQLWSLNEEKDG